MQLILSLLKAEKRGTAPSKQEGEWETPAVWCALSGHHPPAGPFQSSQEECQPRSPRPPQKPPSWAPHAGNEWATKGPLRALRKFPTGKPGGQQTSLSITNEFGDRATPGGPPDPRRAQSQTQPDPSLENQTKPSAFTPAPPPYPAPPCLQTLAR